ncbi:MULTISPECIES: hypothetical protein [unclassified Microcystis]|uniref:hypothetical protein n=1 Tax=unclassified Microcystis TaxID=2643300 RepID=UPI00257D3461|nr:MULTISPECIES: hypothetical protein [unclassified Microcystis]
MDASSENLIANDLQNQDRDSRNYAETTKEDDEWLTLIAEIRQHNRLLKEYFFALEDLATSNAPQEARKATDNIFKQLNGISNSIQANPRVGSIPVPSIPEIILSQKIKGELRKELEARKEAIYREIALQEALLKLLTSQIKTDLKDIQNLKDERSVLPAFAAEQPIEKPDDWIIRRRQIRTMTLSVQGLDDATKATESFKESFKLLLEDRFTIGRANALLSEIESLINVSEDLKRSINQNKMTTGVKDNEHKY